ncbi:hypothetical protein CRG98_010267 [Punica granatum]|uniref:Uncharacterized protein n=1 Tax=Punica granatum TaxID=22663 RepID=A0A2I0KM51_PUNGR|nr:hypothetical protein CRG98_010267 [Punica granatum]
MDWIRAKIDHRGDTRAISQDGEAVEEQRTRHTGWGIGVGSSGPRSREVRQSRSKYGSTTLLHQVPTVEANKGRVRPVLVMLLSAKQNNSATTAAKSSNNNQAGRCEEFVITIFDDGDEVRK